MVETKRPRSLIGTFVRVAVTLGVLAWLAFYVVDWSDLFRVLRQADWAWVAVATFMFGMILVAGAFRWHCFLRVQNIDYSLWHGLRLLVIGQFFSNFGLGANGGDLIRLYYVCRENPGRKTEAALSLIADRALGVFLLLGVAAVIIPFQLAVLTSTEESRLVAFSLVGMWAVLAAGVAVFFLTPWDRLPDACHQVWTKVPGRELMEKAWRAVMLHRRALPLMLRAFFWGIMVIVFNLMMGLALARGLGLDIPPLELLVILALTYAAAGLPISISGHGVREGALVLLFGIYGVADQTIAIAFGVLLFGCQLLWGLVGGVVYLLHSHAEKQDTAKIA